LSTVTREKITSHSNGKSDLTNEFTLNVGNKRLRRGDVADSTNYKISNDSVLRYWKNASRANETLTVRRFELISSKCNGNSNKRKRRKGDEQERTDGGQGGTEPRMPSNLGHASGGEQVGNLQNTSHEN